MSEYNDELLDKALGSLIYWILGHDDEELGNIDFRKAKREVLIVADRVANTKIAEVLDRIGEPTLKDVGLMQPDQYDGGKIINRWWKNRIQAERNKLTQEVGSNE